MTVPPFWFPADATRTDVAPPAPYPTVSAATPQASSYALRPSLTEQLQRAIGQGAANGFMSLPIMQLGRQIAQIGQQAHSGDRQGAFMGLMGLGTQFLPGEVPERSVLEGLAALQRSAGLIGKSEGLAMTTGALETYAARARAAERALEEHALGPETAQTWRKASAASNNSYTDVASQRAADETISRIEDGMTPLQRAAVFGHSGAPYFTAEDARAELLRRYAGGVMAPDIR